jgi:hypothetical protein
MRHIIKIILAVIVTAMITVSCKKEGPQGPAGPEGPRGNPGPDGGVTGTSTGGVLAYTLMEQETLDASLFRWTRETLLPAGNYFLETRFDPDSPWKDMLRLKGDTSGILKQGIALVYLYGYYSSGGGTKHWFTLPHTVKLPTTNVRQFYKHWYWTNDSSDPYELYAGIGVRVFCEQVATTANISPIYNIDGMRIIVIGAGSSGVISGKYRNVPDEQLSMEEAMEKYRLTELDFVPLNPGPA